MSRGHLRPTVMSKKEDVQGASELKQAADKGDALAQNSYGVYLFSREGVARDLKEAARYFKM
jgi:TPR repeat protein